jgi:hypothetical protein
MGQNIGGQAGNRLEVRVRGNAHQLLEKYKVLARDAHQAGDRVAAEYYLQHADHYFRVLNDSRIRQEEMRARRGIFDPLDDTLDDEDGSDGIDPRQDRSDAAEEERGDATPRPDRRDRNRFDRPQREARSPAEPAREDRRPVEAEPALETMSDGEAALLAFGGAPASEAGAELTEPDTPRPARRRGRPRRPEPAPAEG